MTSVRGFRSFVVVCLAGSLWPPVSSIGSPPETPAASSERDRQHDWDWDIGTWKSRMKRRLHPLTGSNTWVEYEGTDVVRKIWDGRANLGEVQLNGPAGHLDILSLRLYNPESHQWSINVASSGGGTLFPPAVGEFKNRRGVFVDQETYNGKSILVRFNISDITPKSFRVEQAFSEDAGQTWEVNLIVTETRMADSADKAE